MPSFSFRKSPTTHISPITSSAPSAKGWNLIKASSKNGRLRAATSSQLPPSISPQPSPSKERFGISNFSFRKSPKAVVGGSSSSSDNRYIFSDNENYDEDPEIIAIFENNNYVGDNMFTKNLYM